MKGNTHIAWLASDDPNCGYGSSALNIRKALSSMGITLHSPGAKKYGGCDIGIAYVPSGMGDIEKLPAGYKIIYTMFEADSWPKQWVDAANCANQVWVPSRFCKESLVSSGCQAPVEIIPLGIDPTVFYPDPFVPRDEEIFTFGYVGACSLRKGFDILTEAFRQEFGAKEPVRLSILSNAVLSCDIPNAKQIDFTEGPVSTAELRNFYHSLDAFVMPTRGEGFGLTPLEAMACGVMPIVTDWGGCRDFLGDHSLRIGVDRLESCEYMSCKGHWAKPSIASLRYCMREAFKNRAQTREMGEKAAAAVALDWTYERTAKIIADLLETVDPSERVRCETVYGVVWHGDPRSVITKAGGFTRGVFRELTPAQLAKLNPSDMHPKGFAVEERLRRI